MATVNFAEYAAAMLGCYAAMPQEEREALHEWEAECIDGSGHCGTSDWPGWEKYIGRFEIKEGPRPDRCGYVYLIQATSGECKIGLTRSVSKRLAQLQTANPIALNLLHFFPASDARAVEADLHRRFASNHIRNEWYGLSKEDIAFVCLLGFHQMPTAPDCSTERLAPLVSSNPVSRGDAPRLDPADDR